MVLKLLRRTLSLSLLALIYCSAILSCSNLINDDSLEQSENDAVNNSQTIYFSGNIDSSISKSSSQLLDINSSSASNNSSNSERTAIPEFLTSSSLSSLFEYFVNAQTVGTSAASTLTATGTVEDGTSYTIALKTGYKWKLTAGIRRKSDNQEIMLDTAEVTLSSSNPTLTKDLILKPVSGDGEIELPINIDSSIPVSKVIVSIGDRSRVVMSDNSVINFSSFPAGSYNAVIELCDSNNVIIYSFVQVINVFPYLKTNKWITGSSAGPTADASGNLIISTSTVQKWARTVFYVAEGKIANGDIFQSSDDDNDGSPYKPFKTISKAIQEINETGNTSTDYTIYVKGTITDHVDINFDSSKIHSLLIKSFRDTNSAVDGNGNSVNDKSVFTINTTVPVIFDGITVQNGSAPEGGGIKLKKGSLELVRCTINNNSATSGGGIYIEQPDTDSATITFSETSITNNRAVNGGGIYNKNTGVVIPDGCVLDSNSANLCGGGIATEAKISITGGSLTNNKAETGGAIYYNGSGTGSFIILGTNAYIPSGSNDKKNDIYVKSGDTISLVGVVSTNASEVKLTLEEYTVGTTILSGNDEFIKSEHKKLILSNNLYSASKYGKVRLKNSIKDLYIEDSAEASDTTPLASITPSSKFKTIKRALQFITFQEDDEADYTLHINGTITGTHIIPASDTTDTDIITIDNTTAKSILIDGENNATLDGNVSTSAAVLDVSTSVPVTITNLKITNGKSHGLQIGKLGITQYNSIVKLGSGAKICGNSTDANGGGVCIEPNGELYMYGDAIIGEAELLGGSYSNSASNSGGGIYCNGGKVYIGYTDNTHSDNSFSGGVYYNYAGFGAGIFLAGTATLNINKGHVVYNYASLQGGGIYLTDSASANIESGTISNNNSVNEGGGIRCAGTGEVVIKNTIIQDNASSGGSASYGGGVYIGDGSYIALYGSSYIPYGTGNDVYLNGSGLIGVGSTLTKSGIVATITPSSYDVGRALLYIPEDVNPDDVIPKFNVRPKDGVDYTISYKDSYGLLNLNITSDNVVEVIGALTENGTVKVLGELTSQKLTEINSAINALPAGVFVYLDLSDVTGVTRLGANIFKDNLHLSSITIPNTVTDIEAAAFAGCTYLCTVDLPENLSLINMEVFADCPYLGTILIPASVKRIGMDAFKNCTGLTEVIIKCSEPPKLTQINTHAFQNCEKLASIIWEGTKETWNAITLEKSSENEWNSGCPSSLKIKCSDGEVEP